jgi:DNA repair protein RadC
MSRGVDVGQNFQRFGEVSPQHAWFDRIDAFAWNHRQAQDERVFVLYLDVDASVQAMRTSPPGSHNHVRLPLRDIVSDALCFACSGVVIAHNHPSGCPAPSRADIEQTRQLARVLLPLGIALEDHMIVAGDQYFSFRAQGLV